MNRKRARRDPSPVMPADLEGAAWAFSRCAGGKLETGRNRIAITDHDVVLDGAAGRSRVPLNGAVARVHTSDGVLDAKRKRHELTYLRVEHSRGQAFELEVWKREVDEAHKIAAVINAAGRALADAVWDVSAQDKNKQLFLCRFDLCNRREER